MIVPLPPVETLASYVRFWFWHTVGLKPGDGVVIVATGSPGAALAVTAQISETATSVLLQRKRANCTWQRRFMS
jgi:hypothetical protein